ncbi:MAG: protein kinase [Polyangiaceae bacterium]
MRSEVIASTPGSSGRLQGTSSSGRLQGTSSLGSYELIGELASGGMATVHLAVQRGGGGFERIVAVKRIHPHLSRNRSFCEMFLDEARIAARINHANVCRILDFGECEDGYFITMEYLVGEPFSQVLRVVSESQALQTPRFPLVVARIAASVAEGLHAAHTLTSEDGQELEIVHRDVSPQNLFLLYDGSVRVTDFGIAQARQRVHKTQGELLKGKLSYMAPEQLERKRLDHRADIWSLGVVMWEALTLRRLFRGQSEGETLMRVMSKPITLPSTFNPDVPPALDRIVQRCLARRVDERYGSARDLARDLERCLANAGDTVPAMDLAEWMQELFPDGKRNSDARVRAVLAQSGFSSKLLAVSPQMAASHPQTTDSFLPQGESAPPPDEVDHTTQVRVVDVPLKTEPLALLQRKRPLAETGTGAPSTVKLAVVATGLGLATLGIVGYSLFSFALRTRPQHEAARVVTAPQLPATPAAVGNTQPAAKPSPSADPALPLAVSPKPSKQERTTPPAAAVAPQRAGLPKPEASAVRAAPAPSQAAVTGSVMVNAKGGSADIFENGRLLGRTPTQLSLPPGNHVLELRPTTAVEPIPSPSTCAQAAFWWSQSRSARAPRPQRAEPRPEERVTPRAACRASRPANRCRRA